MGTIEIESNLSKTCEVIRIIPIFGAGHTRKWIVKDFFTRKGSSTILPTYPGNKRKHTPDPSPRVDKEKLPNIWGLRVIFCGQYL